jgi:hypothetical protein
MTINTLIKKKPEKPGRREPALVFVRVTMAEVVVLQQQAQT